MSSLTNCEENTSVLSRQELLLRAPTRKRKPPADSNGRYGSAAPERPRVVRTTWDMDIETTSTMYDEMGVSLLEDDDEDDLENDNIEKEPQPTPSAPSQSSLLVPPGAPRVTVVPNPQVEQINLSGSHNFGTYPGSAFTHITPYTYIEPQGTTDSSFLIKRHRSIATSGYNQWERLSDEIALCIFRWLPKTVLVRCARVCKRWNRLALDETLWRRIDLSSKTLKSGVVGRVLDRGVAVLRFAKSEIQSPLFKVNPNDSLSLLPRLSKVQYLDLSMSVVSPEGLEELLASCHLLRKLSLENCQVNDNICRYIGQNKNLEVLNMCMCQGVTENGLVPICNNLQRLDALNVGWTDMSRGAVVYLVICLPQSLTKLNLSGCRETLLDEDVQQLCNSCPHLKELDLSDCTLLTYLTVECIASHLGGLEYIALSRCYHVMPSSLPLLSNILTLLALDVFGMLREAALAQLRQALPNIEINKFPFSSIARPTTGVRRTSIWGLRVRDSVV